jgi:hypothetical protein
MMHESDAKGPDELISKQNVGQHSVLTLRQEILDLENKIVEVTHVLHRQPLSSAVRLQLKDDLEYYKQLIDKKRQQLQQLSEGNS